MRLVPFISDHVRVGRLAHCHWRAMGNGSHWALPWEAGGSRIVQLVRVKGGRVMAASFDALGVAWALPFLEGGWM